MLTVSCNKEDSDSSDSQMTYNECVNEYFGPTCSVLRNKTDALQRLITQGYSTSSEEYRITEQYYDDKYAESISLTCDKYK